MAFREGRLLDDWYTDHTESSTRETAPPEPRDAACVGAVRWKSGVASMPGKVDSRGLVGCGAACSGPEGVFDVAEASPEAPSVKLVEVEMPVELGSVSSDGVHDNGPRTELVGAADASA